MLIFTLKIEHQRAGSGASGEAGDAVEASTIWPAVVVVQRLAEVVSVSQYGASNFCCPSVHGFEHETAIIRVSRPNL